MPLSITVSVAAYWSKNEPPCIWCPRWGWSCKIYATTLGDEKLEWWTYQIVKEFRWCGQPLWYNTRMWRADRQTDRRIELAWHIRAIAYMLSRIKMNGKQLVKFYLLNLITWQWRRGRRGVVMVTGMSTLKAQLGTLFLFMILLHIIQPEARCFLSWWSMRPSVSVAQLVNATVHATGTGGQTTLRFSSGDVWFAY